jgi:hypothetical protein
MARPPQPADRQGRLERYAVCHRYSRYSRGGGRRKGGRLPSPLPVLSSRHLGVARPRLHGVGAATIGDGAPPGMRNPTHTQERSMGSEEVYRQGIELVSVARAWLRRSGACYAATALGPPATTGAMPAAAGIPAGARTSGCSGERRHESERPTSQCAVSARDLVTISVERGAPGGGPCEI